MRKNKIALAIASCIAMTAGPGIASSAITGVPGEALLVPLVMTDGGDFASMDTYVGLTVPTTIGTDTIINNFSAPNTTTAGVVTTQTIVPYPPLATGQLGFPRIYWTLFDERSVKVQDGFCPVSPGDMVIWTTDTTLRQAQQVQTALIAASGLQGVPPSACGPTSRPRFGYVVFQTVQGADGLDAGFAFSGDASIVESQLGGMFSVPVLPMADGADSSINDEPRLGNEVIAGGQYGTFQASSPVAVAPVLAGIRMNNANGKQEDVVIQAPIQGPFSGSGHSLHVLWFDRNDANREARMNIWDDQEGVCSMRLPFPRELNIYAYNLSVSIPGFDALDADWANLDGAGFNRDRSVTSLIDAVNPDRVNGYTSRRYCAPTYWEEGVLFGGQGAAVWPGALAGYVEYEFDEIGEPAMPGVVNSAAVAFHLQQPTIEGGLFIEPTTFFAGWSTHMALDRGKH